MLLDCSNHRSIKESICSIFSIKNAVLTRKLESCTVGEDENEECVGKRIYGELIKNYMPPNIIDILWFHGTLSNNPKTFYYSGLKNRSSMKFSIQSDLISCASSLNNSEAVIDENSADRTGKVTNEGPFGYLINLDLYDDDSRPNDYSKGPELITDLVDELFNGDRNPSTIENYKRNLKSYDVAFISNLTADKMVRSGSSLTELQELVLSFALGVLKFLEVNRSLMNTNNPAFDGDGINIDPDQIVRVVIPKRSEYDVIGEPGQAITFSDWSDN
jgi:hypothetical protein